MEGLHVSAHVSMGEEAVSDYERVGGGAAIRTVVDRFYDLVLADPALEGYFVGIDLVRLKRHQALLVAQVMGGPAEYDGRELREAHVGMGITSEDFSRVVAHLAQALQEAGVPDDILGRVADTLVATRSDIVTADAG